MDAHPFDYVTRKLTPHIHDMHGTECYRHSLRLKYHITAAVCTTNVMCAVDFTCSFRTILPCTLNLVNCIKMHGTIPLLHAINTVFEFSFASHLAVNFSISLIFIVAFYSFARQTETCLALSMRIQKKIWSTSSSHVCQIKWHEKRIEKKKKKSGFKKMGKCQQRTCNRFWKIFDVHFFFSSCFVLFYFGLLVPEHWKDEWNSHWNRTYGRSNIKAMSAAERQQKKNRTKKSQFYCSIRPGRGREGGQSGEFFVCHENPQHFLRSIIHWVSLNTDANVIWNKCAHVLPPHEWITYARLHSYVVVFLLLLRLLPWNFKFHMEKTNFRV